MIAVRIIRNAVLICGLFGSIGILQASQQELDNNADARRSNQPSGVELYKQHCAACHGDDLKGVGPVPTPYRVPPNLTTLARRHGGRFPDAYVADVLRNGVTMPAHGPAEMPTWGADFREMDGLDVTQVNLRIVRLTNYIKSRQKK